MILLPFSKHSTSWWFYSHSLIILLMILQRFSKFLQLPVATASTVWANQRAEFKSFCNLIGWHGSHSCNRMLQELGKALYSHSLSILLMILLPFSEHSRILTSYTTDEGVAYCIFLSIVYRKVNHNRILPHSQGSWQFSIMVTWSQAVFLDGHGL